MTWPKCVVVFMVLFGPYGSAFLYFLLPGFVLWLFLAGVVCLIPMFAFSLAALFRLRWRLISILSAVWTLLALPFLGVVGPLGWLFGQGFHVSNLLTGDYPSQCRLSEFVEGGVKQTIGFCRSFDRGDYFDYIVYDTTGEFLLPVSDRSVEWKSEMSKATEEGLESKEGRAHHLHGNFYHVYVPINEMRG